MINKNILSKKGIYLKSIENNSSLKTFRFRKIKLASINKTILIPKINRNSLKSTTYNSDLSNDNIVPKKFEIKISPNYFVLWLFLPNIPQHIIKDQIFFLYFLPNQARLLV